MILEIVPIGGVGRGKPIVIEATQVVVRTPNGTPIAVALHYGPEGAFAVGMAGDDPGGNADFHRLLASAGIHETVICDRLQLPKPPPGAVLVADPRGKRTHG